MTVSLKKQAIDLGIVTRDPETLLGFYRDLLGFAYDTSVDLPGGTTMHRLLCGDSLVKILHHRKEPSASAPPGGIAGATGYRYFTITVDNLEQITEACSQAGHQVPVPITSIRPGVRISIVEDPDGNWVEFLEQN